MMTERSALTPQSQWSRDSLITRIAEGHATHNDKNAASGDAERGVFV